MLHKMIRILVADDSGATRDILNEGIKVHRSTRYIEVDTVANGNAALEVLSKKSIDIAFIDVNMPGMNGPDIIAAMRETKSSNCLTVAISTELDEQGAAILRHFGAYHFLRKPFFHTEVAEIVSTFMTMKVPCPILIVDDSDTMRKLTRKVLKSSRFEFDIFEADNAKAALRALAADTIRIVLTDFHMPERDGIELAGAIHNLSSKIAVYMMSTNDNAFLERSAAFVGISGFLKKPFAPEDIDMIMHKYLNLPKPLFGREREMFSFLEREKKAS